MNGALPKEEKLLCEQKYCEIWKVFISRLGLETKTKNKARSETISPKRDEVKAKVRANSSFTTVSPVHVHLDPPSRIQMAKVHRAEDNHRYFPRFRHAEAGAISVRCSHHLSRPPHSHHHHRFRWCNKEKCCQAQSVRNGQTFSIIHDFFLTLAALLRCADAAVVPMGTLKVPFFARFPLASPSFPLLFLTFFLLRVI